jgi:hypothetical protein
VIKELTTRTKAKVTVHHIFGTPLLIHEAWEPTDGVFGPHSTITHGDFEQHYGQIGTRRQPLLDQRSPRNYRLDAVREAHRAILLAKPWLLDCGKFEDNGTVQEMATDPIFAAKIAARERVIEVEL